MSKYFILIFFFSYCFANIESHLSEVQSSSHKKVLLKANSNIQNLSTREIFKLKEDTFTLITILPNLKNEHYILDKNGIPQFKIHSRFLINIDRVNKMYRPPEKFLEYDKENIYKKIIVPQYSKNSFGIGLEFSSLLSSNLADFIPDNFSDSGFSFQANFKYLRQFNHLWMASAQLFYLNEFFESKLDSYYTYNALGFGFDINRFYDNSWMVKLGLDRSLTGKYDFQGRRSISNSQITKLKLGLNKFWTHKENHLIFGGTVFYSLRSNFNIPGFSLSLTYRWF